MPDIAKERRRLPVVLSLFLDILATALLVFLVYYTVYELPAAYPDSPVMASVNPNSQKLHLSISSTEKGATSKVPNHPDTSAPAADSPSDAADWKTKFAGCVDRHHLFKSQFVRGYHTAYDGQRR